MTYERTSNDSFKYFCERNRNVNSDSSTEAGCPTMTDPDNGKITYLNAKASAMLFCEPNFESVGSSFAHCNGTHWDRVVGTCKETDNAPATSCDFESEFQLILL